MLTLLSKESAKHNKSTPSGGELYGHEFAEKFGVTPSLAMTSEFPGGDVFGVTRVTSPIAMQEPTSPFPSAEALVVSVSLCEIPAGSYEFWVDGRFKRVPQLHRFTVSITDMKSSPVCFVRTPFDYLHFYVPTGALRDVADDLQRPPIHSFRCCLAEQDAVIAQLGRLVISGRSQSAAESDLFGLILAAHLLKSYSGVPSLTVRHRGGLAVWQRHAACEFMKANLHRDLRLAEVASVCSLSSSHFARSFKISLGRSVTRWMAEQRLECAKNLLHGRQVALLEIAQRCGFAGQAAFTRWFSQRTGVSPGGWRRSSARVHLP